jgi:hypothetical protein
MTSRNSTPDHNGTAIDRSPCHCGKQLALDNRQIADCNAVKAARANVPAESCRGATNAQWARIQRPLFFFHSAPF